MGAFRQKREEMSTLGAIETLEGDRYRLLKDVYFNSPSQAAAVLVGFPVSGLDYWKDEFGKSLGEKRAGIITAQTPSEQS